MLVHSELEEKTLTQGITRRGYDKLKKVNEKMVQASPF